MTGPIWKKIVESHEAREVTAQYARDGAFIRVRLPGKMEERMRHRKQRAEPVARRLLMRMVAGKSL
jgi:hypothetical protein